MSAALEVPTEGFPTLREATAADLPFIIDSWLRSYEPTATSLGVPPAWYYAEHRRKVTRLVQESRCVLAVNPTEPSVILGYVVYTERVGKVVVRGKIVVHYVYVKRACRRMGLGRYLLNHVHATGCRYTHHTRAGARLVEALGARYAPESLEG